MQTRERPIEEIRALVGREVGASSWRAVPQSAIDAFADVIDDHQFIHVDPQAAAKTPFGGTIAHGFLTLSLLSTMAYEVTPVAEGAAMGVNYGFDRIRFLAPVPAGARLRGRFTLVELDESAPGQITARHDVTVEIEGEAKPALAARWITRTYLAAAS